VLPPHRNDRAPPEGRLTDPRTRAPPLRASCPSRKLKLEHIDGVVPTVNPKRLSITGESVDNHLGDLLKLIWYAVAGLFRSRATLQTEVLALRHQLNMLRRRAPKRVAVSNIDRLVFAGLRQYEFSS
jgi:hypothetical protein